MQTIRLVTTVGSDGRVRIDAPSSLPPGPAEVIVRPITEPARPALHWCDLRGLGKEIWRGLDAQAYVNELRDEWER
ncbi:MAG: hypothetical protein ACHQ4J_13110 [Candidatus Binatia bacterium]